MSFELPAIDQAKLAALRALQGDVQVFELVKILWPSPTGTRYYGATALHEITPSILPFIGNAPVEPRLAIGDSGTEFFLQINYESALADEEVDLKFTDFDGSFADLAYLHGEGVPVEIFYWFPQVSLLLSQWVGHLQSPKDADGFYYNATAANGFRSSLLNTPNRGMGYTECQATYGGLLQTLGEVAKNACDYNRHLGGSIGKLEDGLPIPDCTLRNRAECQRHFELSDGPLPFLGSESVVEPQFFPQIHGPAILANSVGNESNLKEPLRVVFGYRVIRELDCWAYTPSPNPSTPDHGFVRVLIPMCEGPIESASMVAVNNALIGAEHLVIRRGLHRQTNSGYVLTGPEALKANFSRTALFYANYGWVNPNNFNAANLKGSAAIVGLNNIRVYSNETTYQETYTVNRAWCLMELLRNTVWGHRIDPARFEIPDWIDAAAWTAAFVSYTDPLDQTWAFNRGEFHADLKGRSTQQQVNDLCAAGRLGLPFNYLGKIRILPLRAASEDEITNAPLFTDGTVAAVENLRNIIVEDGSEKPKIKHSRIDEKELPNQIVLSFDDADHGNVERPLVVVDRPAQLRAGRAAGDTTRRVIEKKYSALGVVREAQAWWIANLLLDLGEFDAGGLRNNLSVTFTTWFSHAVELHRYKVIRVLSRQLTRYGFEYFRIQKMARNSDLTVEITAQAYPVGYYAGLETVTDPVGQFGYEAEDEANDLAGSAEVHEDADCSNNFKVVGLGNDGGFIESIGTLTFTGVTGIDGSARVTVYYKCTETRTLWIRANSGPAMPLSCPASGDLPISVFCTLDTVNSDENTVTIFNNSGLCPDIDRILVEPIEIDPGGGSCRPGITSAEYVGGRLVIEVPPC